MFLKDHWYAAAFSNEIKQEILPRTLLNEPVVLFRKQDGTPAALHDQCPHRFMPLSSGSLVSDEVQCGYHGLRFDSEGACTRIPSQSHIPASACVKNYPVIDKYGLVWIWFGAKELADETLIPNWDIGPGLEHHEDSAWASCQDYFKPMANYSLVVDNLLDLSHVVYVHGSSFGSEDINNVEVDTECEGTGISDRRALAKCKPAPAFVGYVGDENTPVDFWMDMHWQAPSNMLLEFGVTVPGKPRDKGFQWLASHLLTPETAQSTHYFWVVSRGFDQYNHELTKAWHDTVYSAFEEDEAILAQQQKVLGERELLKDLRPIILASDKSAIQARKINAGLFGK